MNMFKIGDIVQASDTGDTKYLVVDVKRIPGDEGAVYLVESREGVRLQRYGSQLTKVEK